MSEHKYFGTDGIRGPVNGPLINPKWVNRVGHAIGMCINKHSPKKKLRVAIGRDTRSSGSELSDAFIQGLNAENISATDLGIVPTSTVALYTKQNPDINLGIVFTASHNPASDNGIKFFDSHGLKLSLAFENELERWIDQALNSETLPKNLQNPTNELIPGDDYFVDYLKKHLPKLNLKNTKIVLDTANGATFKTSKALLESYGATVISFADQPNGTNINQSCGSEYPKTLCALVRAQHADIGIAHDGDGDRVVVCDENGELIEGDILLGIMGAFLKQTRTLNNDTIIITIQSNYALDHFFNRLGIFVLRVPVGDRNVMRKMLDSNACFGGESSGHIIFRDYLPTGDGLVAACMLLHVMQQTQQSLSQLKKQIQLYPQAVEAVTVFEKRPLENLEGLQEAIHEGERRLAGKGRILVRYSGTESKIRLLVEADSALLANAILQSLKAALLLDFSPKN